MWWESLTRTFRSSSEDHMEARGLALRFHSGYSTIEQGMCCVCLHALLQAYLVARNMSDQMSHLRPSNTGDASTDTFWRRTLRRLQSPVLIGTYHLLATIMSDTFGPI